MEELNVDESQSSPSKKPKLCDIVCGENEIRSKLIDCMASFRKIDEEINANLWFIRLALVTVTMQEDVCQLSGSVRDGASIAKWFSYDPAKREIEADMQHTALTLDEEDKPLIIPVDGKPDNVKIRTSRHVIEQKAHRKVHELITIFCEQSDPDCLRLYDTEFLNPQLFRRMGQHVYKFKGGDTAAAAVAAALFGLAIDKFESEIVEDAPVKGTALTTTLQLRHMTFGHVFRASLDNVVVFHCRFWPDVASDFHIRKSRKDPTNATQWPTSEERVAIMKEGCDIAPKPSSDGDLLTEWRWSFGNAEKRLMQGLSANQHRAYFVAKILFYRYLKPIDSENMHSYWIKTCMFWCAEEHPSSDSIWSDENILLSIELFFQELLIMVDKWNLPHFIIPTHSLLRYTDKALQPRMYECISGMVNNIRSYIPTLGDFSEVEAMLEGPRHIIDALVSFSQGKKDKKKSDGLCEVYSRQSSSETVDLALD